MLQCSRPCATFTTFRCQCLSTHDGTASIDSCLGSPVPETCQCNTCVHKCLCMRACVRACWGVQLGYHRAALEHLDSHAAAREELLRRVKDSVQRDTDLQVHQLHGVG